MANFKAALCATVNELIGTSVECAQIYWDDNFSDVAYVWFLEEGGSDKVHDIMAQLHVSLSDKMGRPVSICHNEPTDGMILIHGGEHDSRVYDKTTCCKTTTIDSVIHFLGSDRSGHTADIRTIALLAERICVQERMAADTPYCDEDTACIAEDVVNLLNILNWNDNITYQLTNIILSVYA